MNFKRLNFLPCLTGIILLSNVSSLLAESAVSSAVTNPEKSDKVVTDSKTAQIDTNARVLQEAQWEMAGSGESILSLPVLNQVINEWLLDKEKKIEIRYPGGEEGEFWVQQLTDWLVSLGIPTDNMLVIPGSGADDTIKFNIIK